ncbi:HET-domain-containing protein [Aaosphaeria arxii CBS 175.79]|uniref:HET-domain-containing protein n=1 Tax=Aaosphaeria arxii CBS 175.79 TaxID=1450172 RepID=A0A6A5XN17_9PLEO|nr:HET-domain-containing protein [Aaosphaeria arxii CBS 175.79]KAF2014512.1 HET-domain-containing protein [Aaosphaeria arxii CBS 175.79]
MKSTWDNRIAVLVVQAFYSPGHTSRCHIDIWVDPAKGDDDWTRISSKEPIDRLGGAETMNCIESWLDRCLSKHETCRKSLTGTLIDEKSDTIPAKRILDIGNSPNDRVRVIETNDIASPYCALSHCWGPPEKKPMCLDSASKTRLSAGIYDHELPKTFREAISITRALGTRYLWIDCLCIIQDSAEDWAEESQRMGLIYERSLFRIAACGARDSTEGCFLDMSNIGKRVLVDEEKADVLEKFPLPEKVRPNTVTASPKGEPSRFVYFRGQPEQRVDHDGPDDSALGGRAWAFQESLLSRRTVNCLVNNLTWECKEQTLDQRDCDSGQNYIAVDYSTWECSIERYTRCELTYESDRLIALSGYVNELSKTRQDSYELGLWTAGLPMQLLWRISHHEMGMKGIENLPSWTWARLPGSKSFPHLKLRPPTDVKKARLTMQFIRIIDATKLTLHGRTNRCFISDINLLEDEIYYSATYGRPESMFIAGNASIYPMRFLWANESKSRLIGAVQLDEDSGLDELCFAPVQASRRNITDSLHPEYEEFILSPGHGPAKFQLTITPPEGSSQAKRNEDGLTDWVG